MANCESCLHFVEDEETGELFCDMSFDEDDYARMSNKAYKECPYYRYHDDYDLSRHQI